MIRAFFAVLAAVLGVSLAGCGGDGANQPVQSTEVTAPASLSASPTTPSTTSASPKPDTMLPLTSRDFIGYVPSGKPGEWKPNGSTGLPTLRANSTQVTAFIYGGVTCQVTLLNGVQATPARVLGMFAALKNNPNGSLHGSVPPGAYDYILPAEGGGVVTVGTYVCK